MLRISHRVILSWGAALIAVTSGISRAGYAPGYVWNRQAVWYGGTGDGTINGDPNVDSMGNPAWEYLALGGDGLNSSDPWYAAGPSQHSILGSFSTSGGNGWIGGAAYAFQDHFYHEHGASRAPGVSWQNPTNSPSIVDVVGTMQFTWEQGAPNAVEFVIAKENLQTFAASILYQNTASPAASVTFPVSLSNVSLAANEGLLFTYRAQAGSVGLYTGTDSFNVTLLPEPSTLTALASIALAVGSRRQRGCK